MDTEKIGWSLVMLGCGQTNNTEKLDYTAGIEFFRKTGDIIKKGDPIFRVFNSNYKNFLQPKTFYQIQ